MNSLDVLIVEDNDLYAEIIERLVEPLRSHFGQCTIRKVSTLAAALKEAQRIPPYDIILLDLTLPDSTIEETINKISELESHSAVVIVTGNPAARAKMPEDRPTVLIEKNIPGIGGLIIESIVKAISNWKWRKTERDINRLQDILTLLDNRQEPNV